MNLKNLIREFPNFPKPDISFKDISPLLKNPEAMKHITSEFQKFIADKNIDVVAGIESRGLIFAATLAMSANKSFVMIRKAGKLPGNTMPVTYDLEYGNATIEIQHDALLPGERVIIIDDLLATGGTSRAAGNLIESARAVVAGYAFVVELSSLRGRDFIAHPEIKSLVTYRD